MAATIDEISEKAGVFRSTVSRILNGSNKHRFKKDTEEKVLQVAREMNYIPNHFARSLNTGRSRTFGLVIFDAVDPYYMEILRGAEEVINSNDYTFLLSDVQNDEKKLKNYLEIFLQRKTDGILIIANSFVLSDKTIMDLTQKEIPLVIVGRDIKDSHVRCVRIDNFKGGFLAVEHLISLGHKKIGFIIGPPEIVDSRERWRGGKSAMEKHGLMYDERLVEQEGSAESCSRPEYGYQAMRKLFEKDNIPTAIFTFDDITALGAIRFLQEKGVRVPEGISVMGFDDIPIAAYYNPPLTTIRQPMLKMGEQAAEMLLRMAEQKDDAAELETVIIEPELMVRSSTCPVP